jgi:hypothetical protein
VRLALGVCIVAAAAAASAKPVPTYVVSTPAVEILDPSGAIQRPAVEQGIAALADELRKCRDVGWQSDALAWIVVDWHGHVTRLEIAVPKPDAEKCLTGVLKKLAIATAQARATVVVRLRIENELVTDIKELDPEAAKNPPPAPPSSKAKVEIARITVGSDFADPERIKTIVRRHAETLRACYAIGIDHGAPTTNKVTLKLSVDAAGVVFGAQVLATASPREMVDCYKRELPKLSFPLPTKAPTTVEIEQRPPA